MPDVELDARVLPKPEKHKTIFATFAKLAVGESAEVVWKLAVQRRELDADVIALSAGEDTGMHVGPEVDALIHVLSGSGRLSTELSTIDLAAGALLWMPRRSRRQFVAGPNGLRYLNVHQQRQFLGLTPAVAQAG